MPKLCIVVFIQYVPGFGAGFSDQFDGLSLTDEFSQDGHQGAFTDHFDFQWRNPQIWGAHVGQFAGQRPVQGWRSKNLAPTEPLELVGLHGRVESGVKYRVASFLGGGTYELIRITSKTRFYKLQAARLAKRIKLIFFSKIEKI